MPSTGGNIWITSSSGSSTGGNIAIGTRPTPVRGGDITFRPGQGVNGAPGGSVIWEAADGTELLRLDEKGISLYGQEIPIASVLKFLSKLNERLCSCSTAQLLTAGCKCGGT